MPKPGSKCPALLKMRLLSPGTPDTQANLKAMALLMLHLVEKQAMSVSRDAH